MTSSGAVKSQNVKYYTHFVSLPLPLHHGTVTKLNNLQNSVLATTKDLGIEKSMFINPKTFHLTVLMLKLSNNDQIEAAAEVLRSVSPKVNDALKRRPVSIRLKGLGCMRGSPAKAYVVHAPVEVIGDEARLLDACKEITKAFTEAGLVLEKDAKKKLELHATIMNAKHRKSKKKSEKTEPFDARTIFGQYGSEEWGVCRIREAHLSQRFAYDSNGYFRCRAFIPFPEEKHGASIPFPEEKQGAFGMKKNFFQKMFSMGK